MRNSLFLIILLNLFPFYLLGNYKCIKNFDSIPNSVLKVGNGTMFYVVEGTTIAIENGTKSNLIQPKKNVVEKLQKNTNTKLNTALKEKPLKQSNFCKEKIKDKTSGSGNKIIKIKYLPYNDFINFFYNHTQGNHLFLNTSTYHIGKLVIKGNSYKKFKNLINFVDFFDSDKKYYFYRVEKIVTNYVCFKNFSQPPPFQYRSI